MAKKNDVNLISVTHKRDEFHRNGWLKLSFAFSYSLKSQTHKIMSEHRNCKDIEGGKNIYGKNYGAEMYDENYFYASSRISHINCYAHIIRFRRLFFYFIF